MVILPFWSTFVCSPVFGHLYCMMLWLLMKITVLKFLIGVLEVYCGDRV
jgi:hypothetical protein